MEKWLTMDVNFLLSNDNDNKQLIYSKENKKEIKIGKKVDETIT